jgi:hypothetical protein
LFTGLSRFSHCQNKDRIYVDSNDSLFWNNRIYVCNKSPLSFFEGYRDLYPDVLTLFSSDTWDKDYILNWAIINDKLYLCDIPLIRFKNESDYDGSRHLAIEKLTARKFRMPDFYLSDCLKPKINPNGVIFADWFSDNLYIKLYIKENEWNIEFGPDEAYFCVQFKNGVIMNIKEYK